MTGQERILVTLPTALYSALFAPEVDANLRSLGTVVFNETNRNWSSDELADRVSGCTACIIGWESPRIDDKVLNSADRLRIVAHTGGTLKQYCPPAVFERGIIVTQAASALAPAVAELTLLLSMLCLRRVHEIHLSSPVWFDPSSPDYSPGNEIAGQDIGCIGAGWSGRAAIKLFQSVGARVCVSDPYLSKEDAERLGVTIRSLDELLQSCNVVSLHAPITKETHHLIDRSRLALLQDGAIFINTARAWCVDSEALLAEAKTGRIVVALDVFDEEPLPLDSPFRNIPNVVLTPHLGGNSTEARYRQGRTAVDELGRFFRAEPLHNQVTIQMLSIMA